MTHINLRRDTAANWTSANPVLQHGETGWEEDTRKGKMGDGSTAWNALPYLIEAEVTSVNGQTGDVVLDKGDVGLGNVDNTPDANKPVSIDQQAALDLKAPLASPALTGSPTAPTPTAGDNDTSIATTAFVQAEMAAAPYADMIVYTGNGSFAKASYPGLKAVRYRVQASGGAGGGSETTAAGEHSKGSGGGAGGYSEGVVAVDDLAASETVTVGAAATGVSAGNGNNGNSSSFGTHGVATGGSGGVCAPATSASTGTSGGAGGTGTAGDLMTTGAGGGNATGSGPIGVSGPGGTARLGGGAPGRGANTSQSLVGVAGGNYGGGGGGALTTTANAANVGGASGPGVVIIELIY